MTRYARFKGNSHRQEFEATNWEDMKNITKKKEEKDPSKVERTEKRRLKRQEDKKSKMICFNCRKSGHGVQDCPEKTHGMDKNLKSRVCFICGSKDHRALQCPSNPRGLYPDGGGCKFCGDVTHLYMACPKKLGKEETVEEGEVCATFNPMENTETLYQSNISKPTNSNLKIKKKIVKF